MSPSTGPVISHDRLRQPGFVGSRSTIDQECQNPSVWCAVTTQEPNGQPHDAPLPAGFSDPDNAASELRSVLPPRLAAHIDLANLQPQPGTFVDPNSGTCTPTCCSAPPPVTANAYLYLLVEHQRTSDPVDGTADDDLPDPHLGASPHR